MIRGIVFLYIIFGFAHMGDQIATDQISYVIGCGFSSVSVILPPPMYPVRISIMNVIKITNAILFFIKHPGCCYLPDKTGVFARIILILCLNL